MVYWDNNMGEEGILLIGEALVGYKGVGCQLGASWVLMRSGQSGGGGGRRSRSAGIGGLRLSVLGRGMDSMRRNDAVVVLFVLE